MVCLFSHESSLVTNIVYMFFQIFNVLFLCIALNYLCIGISFLHVAIKLSKHNLSNSLSSCLSAVLPLSHIKFLYICGSLSELAVLFHWSALFCLYAYTTWFYYYNLIINISTWWHELPAHSFILVHECFEF